MMIKRSSLLNIILVAYVSLLRLCLKNTNPSIVLYQTDPQQHPINLSEETEDPGAKVSSVMAFIEQ